MKGFLKQIGIFSVLLIAVCLIVFGFQTWNIRNNADFKLDKNYKYLQLGHSHPQCAYNDTLIANFKNISASAESYFYTYYKLDKLLEHNDAIEVVLLEFTNNQIDVRRDKWIWGDKYLSRFYPQYGSFFDSEDTAFLMKKNSNSLLNSFTVLQKRNLWRVLRNDYDFVSHIGGYQYLTENNIVIESTTQGDSSEVKYEIDIDTVSETNILYLEKIVALCKAYNKKLIFIRSPQHATLSSRENEIKFLEIYNEKFKEVPMIDFNDYPIPDKGFKDRGHLNYLGAQIISKTLDSLLVSGITNDIFEGDSRRLSFPNKI